jgi:hypothetical protein
LSYKEKNLAYDEDANQKSKKSTESKESQESTQFEKEGSSEDFTDSQERGVF